MYLFNDINIYAWQTKIVAHFVSGIHRLTTVDMVLVGFNSHHAPEKIVRIDSLKDSNVNIRKNFLSAKIEVPDLKAMLFQISN
jgi:hypothetical protein